MASPKWSKLTGNQKASPKFLYETGQAEEVGNKIVIVAVNVSTGNGTGSSAADPKLVGGLILGILPAGNQDQIVDNVELETDGKVKVTLAANATAQNNFKVTVLKA